VTVQNNTALFGTPHNFGLATFTPFFAFSPNPSVPSPNPIPPGGTGTFSTTYTGQSGYKCFSVIFSNANRTRCCPQSVCFDLPPCQAVRPDRCAMQSHFICNSNGPTPVTFYITNNSGSSQSYQWTITPVAMPGCTGTLPANAFTPASGTTSSIGSNRTQGVTLNVNTASIAPGQCAGFEVCFTPSNAPGAVPVCCRAVVQCPGIGTPCVIIHDALARSFPGGVIGIPVEIKNPTDIEMNVDLVFSDSEGLLAFSTGDGEPAVDMPLSLTLGPLESVTYLVLASEIFDAGDFERVAIGTIVVGPPCVFFPDRTDRYASALLFFSPEPPADPALLLPAVQFAIGDSRMEASGPGRNFQFDFAAPAGSTVQLMTTNDFMPGSERRLLPAIDGLVVNPDGTFYCDGSVRTITIPLLPDNHREFYYLQNVDAAPLDPEVPLEVR
jgi:hypothetical protein